MALRVRSSLKAEERCTTEKEINEVTPPPHYSGNRKDNQHLRAPPYLRPVSRRAIPFRPRREPIRNARASSAVPG